MAAVIFWKGYYAMKKLLAIVLCGASMLLFASCGKEEEPAAESTGGMQMEEAPEDDSLDWGDLEVVE